ncbi:hypothetical protein N7537_012287, partial [Penicillium hordei]
DSYPKCGQEWNEDDSSDLVNHFGKSLEKVGLLDKGQMAEVLERAKWAGFTRWHMLTALDGSCFSSTYRTDCYISFGVTVKFEVSTLSLGTHRCWQLTYQEHDAAMNPFTLDRKYLSAISHSI